jgi:hypothetical protein
MESNPVVTATQTSAFAGNMVNRSMLIECKRPQ